jgi:hypothetical protein
VRYQSLVASDDPPEIADACGAGLLQRKRDHQPSRISQGAGSSRPGLERFGRGQLPAGCLGHRQIETEKIAFVVGAVCHYAEASDIRTVVRMSIADRTRRGDTIRT